MKSICLVEVLTDSQERFFKKCRSLGISILKCEVRKHQVLIHIYEKDIPKLKKIWFISYLVLDYYGTHKFKNWFQKQRLFLICLFLSFFFFLFLSHLILSVEVIHSSLDIRSLVLSALEEKGIKKLTLKKSYKELEEIKKQVLDEYQEYLEWMEIESVGMKYKVRVEERKMENIKTEAKACHIIASKEGMIKNLYYDEGEALVKRNDYVKKGDLLISGIIKHNEEEKGVVCAKGRVEAEVWYKIDVSFPLEYEQNIRTGKVRYNIALESNLYKGFIFKSRIENYEEEKKLLKELFHTKIYFVKQYEVVQKSQTYSSDEAVHKALEEAEEKLKSKLTNQDKILTKKILKKEQNNGIMNVEIFVSVLENIAKTLEFERVEGEGDGNV